LTFFKSFREITKQKEQTGKRKKKKKKELHTLRATAVEALKFSSDRRKEKKILLDDQAEFSLLMVKLRLVLPAICASICALFVCLFVFQFDYDRLFRTWIL